MGAHRRKVPKIRYFCHALKYREHTDLAPLRCRKYLSSFIARLQHNLLEQGRVTSGIIAADAFDLEIIQRIYKPHDNLTLMVDLSADGKSTYEILSGVGDASASAPNTPTTIQD